MKQQQEPEQSVKSPEQQYEPETPAQERIRKGKMPQEQAYTEEPPQRPVPTERPTPGVRIETQGARSEMHTDECDFVMNFTALI